LEEKETGKKENPKLEVRNSKQGQKIPRSNVQNRCFENTPAVLNIALLNFPLFVSNFELLILGFGFRVFSAFKFQVSGFRTAPALPIAVSGGLL